MSHQQDLFDDRYRRIARRHRRLSRGYVMKLDKSGMLMHKPKRSARAPVSALVTLVVFLGAALIVFKAISVSVLGPFVYRRKLDALGEGGVIDHLGGFFMQIDPVTASLAQLIALITGS